MTLETKTHQDPALKGALQDLLYTFETFKDANDERLASLEKRGNADPLVEDRLSRINDAMDRQQAALDALTAKSARPALDASADAATSEEKAAFDTYLRTGMTAAPALKSLSGDDPSGALLAPAETAQIVSERLAAVSPFRQLATVTEISGNTYRKPVQSSGFAANWAAESGARTETTTPTLEALDFPVMDLYAMPAATQGLLDDGAVDLTSWIAQEVETAFADQESQAFVAGTGINQPQGILSYPTAADAGRAFGQLGTTSSGGASISGDDLIDLIYALPHSYRLNGSFIVNRLTMSEIRKLKDSDGQYLWTPGFSNGQSATLLGYRVIESEDMPDVDNGNTPVAFGDFRRGYLIVDRAGIQVLRDPFSAKPYVLFYTTKRVGGGVQDFEAIKFLEMSA